MRCANHIREYNNRNSSPSVKYSSKFIGTRRKEHISQYFVLWKDGAKVEIVLRWEAMKSVPFGREGFYGSSRAQSERPLCLIPCFAWGYGCSTSARTEIPVLQSSWLSHPVPSECVEPFLRNSHATSLWYCAWISDHTNQGEKKNPTDMAGMCRNTAYIFTTTAVSSPSITGQCKDPRGRTEFWHCHLVLVWPYASHSASKRQFLYLKKKGGGD